jgi:hypothetical protein
VPADLRCLTEQTSPTTTKNVKPRGAAPFGRYDDDNEPPRLQQVVR